MFATSLQLIRNALNSSVTFLHRLQLVRMTLCINMSVLTTPASFVAVSSLRDEHESSSNSCSWGSYKTSAVQSQTPDASVHEDKRTGTKGKKILEQGMARQPTAQTDWQTGGIGNWASYHSHDISFVQALSPTLRESSPHPTATRQHPSAQTP